MIYCLREEESRTVQLIWLRA